MINTSVRYSVVTTQEFTLIAISITKGNTDSGRNAVPQCQNVPVQNHKQSHIHIGSLVPL